ncbi:uncharacterized protein [Melopsittacus undulatus]|uniref:uncharacterized protein n=1 Tax=Melopsittacus undulatus TaxID=13146 RepID=UPI00146DFC59|nr:uncharacterized protein LOC115945481 [Melopsittacus undulatus]
MARAKTNGGVNKGVNGKVPMSRLVLEGERRRVRLRVLRCCPEEAPPPREDLPVSGGSAGLRRCCRATDPPPVLLLPSRRVRGGARTGGAVLRSHRGGSTHREARATPAPACPGQPRHPRTLPSKGNGENGKNRRYSLLLPLLGYGEGAAARAAARLPLLAAPALCVRLLPGSTAETGRYRGSGLPAPAVTADTGCCFSPARLRSGFGRTELSVRPALARARTARKSLRWKQRPRAPHRFLEPRWWLCEARLDTGREGCPCAADPSGAVVDPGSAAWGKLILTEEHGPRGMDTWMGRGAPATSGAVCRGRPSRLTCLCPPMTVRVPGSSSSSFMARDTVSACLFFQAQPLDGSSSIMAAVHVHLQPQLLLQPACAC